MPITLFTYRLNILKIYVIILGFITLGYFCITFFRILRSENRSTVAHTNVISPAVPLAVIFTCTFCVFRWSSENLFELHPCIFVLTFGSSVVKCTCNLIVATMSKSRLPLFDVCLVGPCVLVLWIFVRAHAVVHTIGIHGVSEYSILIGTGLFNLIQFLLFTSGISREVSQALKFNVFTIPYNVEKQT